MLHTEIVREQNRSLARLPERHRRQLVLDPDLARPVDRVQASDEHFAVVVGVLHDGEVFAPDGVESSRVHEQAVVAWERRDEAGLAAANVERHDRIARRVRHDHAHDLLGARVPLAIHHICAAEQAAADEAAGRCVHQAQMHVAQPMLSEKQRFAVAARVQRLNRLRKARQHGHAPGVRRHCQKRVVVVLEVKRRKEEAADAKAESNLGGWLAFQESTLHMQRVPVQTAIARPASDEAAS